MEQLQLLMPDCIIEGIGGPSMEARGLRSIVEFSQMNVSGFLEVLKSYPKLLSILRQAKQAISNGEYDAFIAIDYPGFNMRIAKWAKRKGIKTHYYIAPQIWAWKENRIKAVKRDFDKLFVILPFEKDFFEIKHHFPVEFVGHPLIDAIQNRIKTDEASFRKENNLNEKPIIAILPGSRKQEISKMLSVMLSIVKDFPDYQFVIAGAPSQEYHFYKPFLTNENVKFISNKTYDLLSIATAALVTSGTATLETALFKVPEVVCYKGSWASYQIAKRIITLKYISLVNLIMDEVVVTELIQDKFNPKNLKQELSKLLEENHRKVLLKKYDDLESKLGGVGASEKTAKIIVKVLKNLA
jgi:lipid-A-disaccharide synthase